MTKITEAQRFAAALIRDDLYTITETITADILDTGVFTVGPGPILRHDVIVLNAVWVTSNLSAPEWLRLCGALRDGGHYIECEPDERSEWIEREPGTVKDLIVRLDTARASLAIIDGLGYKPHRKAAAALDKLDIKDME